MLKKEEPLNCEYVNSDQLTALGWRVWAVLISVSKISEKIEIDTLYLYNETVAQLLLLPSLFQTIDFFHFSSLVTLPEEAKDSMRIFSKNLQRNNVLHDLSDLANCTTYQSSRLRQFKLAWI